jgi:O-antigen/teichoic acid export membrane protein
LLILAFPAVIASRELISFLYGEKFLIGENIFIVYTFAEIVKFANISVIIVSKNKKRELAMFLLFMLVMNIGLDILMFLEYGPIGCAVATLIVTFTIQTYILFRSVHLTNLRFSKIMNWKMIILAFFECGVLWIAFYFVKPYLTEKITNTFVQAVIFYGIPVLMLIALNASFLLKIYKKLNNISNQ